MSFDNLCQQILSLTEQVEQLLADKEEQECAALLQKRQNLLEELQTLVVQTSQSEMTEKFQQFLLAIQQRDNQHIAAIQQEFQNVLTASAKNVNAKKAIKAYRSHL